MTTATESAPSDVLDRARARLERAEAARAGIGVARAPFTRANVLVPFNEIGIELANVASECSLMAEVHPEPLVRAAADTAIQELSAFGTRLGQDRPVYDALSGIDGATLDPLAFRRGPRARSHGPRGAGQGRAGVRQEHPR